QVATKVMMRFVYPRATGVIAVSNGVAGKLARDFGVRTSSIEIIPNPVDSEALEAAAQDVGQPVIDEPYVVAVGRLVKVKNFKLLLRAFAKSGLQSRLVIAGDGPERERLAVLAAELGIRDRVTMTGWLSNPYPVLRGASVFALSSNIEGFPNALVEALALGVPAVATNCVDGPAEILAGRSTAAVQGLTVAEAGILTPVGDVDSFARALQLAFEQPLRDRLAAAGRKRAADYSATAIAADYWAVIARALPRVGAGQRLQARSAA
ncbi:MAG TPA: glycosyltransferase, partial [Sphingomicrobium sp.]